MVEIEKADVMPMKLSFKTEFGREIFEACSKAEVGDIFVLTPEDGQEVRALASSVKNAQKKLKGTYFKTVQSEGKLYVERTDKPPKKKDNKEE